MIFSTLWLAPAVLAAVLLPTVAATQNDAISSSVYTCPLADAPFSIDTPLIDLLQNEHATEIVRRDFGTFLDTAPPVMVSTAAPSFGAIVTPRSLISWAGVSKERLPPIDAALRAVPVTDVDRAKRCARYDDEVPSFDLPADKPAILVFEKMTGFRDGPSVEAARLALAKMGERNGWTVVFTESAGVMRPELLRQFRSVVWNNVSGDVLTLPQRAAFREYIEGGGGFVGIHGSGGDPVTYWDWYVDELIGARFAGHARDPQFQTASVTIEHSDDNGALADGLPLRWVLEDEWYSFTANPRDRGAEIVATIDEDSYDPGDALAMGSDHPIAWARRPGEGRAFYTAIGHLPHTYTDTNALTLLENGIAWTARLR